MSNIPFRLIEEAKKLAEEGEIVHIGISKTTNKLVIDTDIRCEDLKEYGRIHIRQDGIIEIYEGIWHVISKFLIVLVLVLAGLSGIYTSIYC